MIPLSAAPLAYSLIVITVALSLFALMVDNKFYEDNLFHVGAILDAKQFHRMITSGFLHVDNGHLLMNMLTLYFFGPLLEYKLGTLGFAIIYFGSLFIASLLPLYTKRDQPTYRAVGASGAISGVLLSFCLFEPFSMLYLFFAIPIPAVLFAVGYIAYSTMAMKGPSHIGHDAHLGGAIGGIILTLILVPDVVTRFF
ncbi:MAG: rhomboid family intramembrane serine protease [Parvularculaceae bacterium]